MVVAYEDEKIVGFMDFLELENYAYLIFFAINSNLRGGGYGNKMILSFQALFLKKTVIASIETPIPGTSNYERRIKRKAFYKRTNLFTTPPHFFSYGMNEENMLTVISNNRE